MDVAIVVLGVAHALGILSSFNALMSVRTSQGAIAWIVSLNTFPILTVPLYWVFGRTHFQGYVKLRQGADAKLTSERQRIKAALEPYFVEMSGPIAALQRLAQLPTLRGNKVQLLVDGEDTFASILDGIEQAKEYVLVQFYIIHDDELGRKLKDCLLRAKRRGVRVWLLYDELGSSGLGHYVRELVAEGVDVRAFNSRRGRGNFFQLNFRNHRKIVVVDGMSAWVGGHNVGDEYLGKSRKFPVWRDTHMQIVGPAALSLQISFLEDWNWSAQEVLQLEWKPSHTAQDAQVMIVPSGPVDKVETCSLMFQLAINSSQSRCWIATPYFIPDEAVVGALILAKMRGVDVKVLIPDRPDNWLIYFSEYDFVGKLLRQGIEIYRYLPGFNHQKVFIIDDRVASVGTANLDNRSLRLNFEVTALVSNTEFVQQVDRMLKHDIAHAKLMTEDEIENKHLWFRVCARASYLLAPIQ